MDLSGKDYNRFYRMQDKFLHWWSNINLPFYLTGGTALGRFYLQHRYSEDLDFFVNNDSDFPKHILFIKNELQKVFHIDINNTMVTDEFARFFIYENETFLKIEFVNDQAHQAGSPLKTEMGYIDNVTNILSNKLSAIVGRDEPKDIFDIVSISGNFSFNWKEIFLHTKEKAMVNELDVGQRLFTFPVKTLMDVDWLLKPINIRLFEQNLKMVADDFILGLDNSLGVNKESIDKAEIIW